MISLSSIKLLVDLKAKDEEYLEFLRDLAISQLETETGRTFTLKQNHDQIFNIVRYQELIQLKLRPVVAINSVHHRDYDTQDWTEILSTQYNFTAPSSIRLVTGCFKKQVKVNTDFGYTESTVPDKIKNALLVQIRYLNNRLDPSKIDIKTKALDGGKATSYMTQDKHPIFETLVKTLKNG